MANTYIGLVKLDSGDQLPIGASLYGTCNTAAATAQKEVTLPELNRLFTGLTVHIKFTTANSATAPTLKFSGMPSTEAAIAIKNYGTGSSLAWAAGALISFTYDGTNWVMHDNNSTYSAISETEVKSDSSTTARLVTGQRVNQAIDNKLSGLTDTLTGTPAASKTITAFDQVDGKVSATFADITIAESQITNLTTHLGQKAPIASPTFTGTVTLPGAPTSDLHAATKKYVDDKTAGLSGAMHFKGSTSSTITDGGTQTVQVDGANLTATAGDVVLSGDKEFVWTGSKWELLGDEGSYALKTITVTGSNGLTGGGAISSDQVISHAARSSSITSDTLGTTDTARTYIKSITLDAYGHITGVGTGTESVKNTDTKVTQNILATSVTDNYPLLLANYKKDVTTTTATTANRVQAIYVQPSTGTLFATKFSGDGSSLTNVTASSVAWANVTDKVTAAKDTLGIVKTTSTVTSTSGLTAAPIIDGVVYYKDTNDHYTSHLYVTNSSGTAKTTTALTNGNVYLKLYDTSTARESYKISGSGITEVVTDASGNITVKTKSYTATANTTINYLKDANYVKTASVTDGVLTITTVTDASTIKPVTAISASF